jgi:hypothetical protein
MITITKTPTTPFLSRDVRNRWDWYRVIPRQRLLDPAYMRLDALCTGVLERMTWVAWEQGWVPSSPADIAYVTRLEESEIRAALPVLLDSSFVVPLEDGSGLWLPRSESHLQELLKEAEARSEKARKAAQASRGSRTPAASSGDSEPFQQ